MSRRVVGIRVHRRKIVTAGALGAEECQLDMTDCCSTTTSTTTTSTSTTTTPGPCVGLCESVWNAATNLWSFTDIGCSSKCGCLRPNYCGSNDGEITQTYCVPSPTGSAVGDIPCCGQTTSSTTSTSSTTTTLPPSCIAGCDWGYAPGTIGWVQKTNGCSAGCPCPAPNTSPAECTTAHTDCIVSPPPPPPPGCGGACLWWYDDGTVYDTSAWHFISSSCSGGNYGCICDPPSEPAECGDKAYTGCYEPPPPSTTPGPGTTTTTTTCAPTTTTSCPTCCDADCFWAGDGAGGWTLQSTTCPFTCLCASKPIYASLSVDETATTLCTATTTTTTTTSSTTTTTTTTTTANPCDPNTLCSGTCLFWCNGSQWVYTGNTCDALCGCADLQGGDCMAQGFGAVNFTYCCTDIPLPTTTTTTTTTSSTTTTGTTSSSTTTTTTTQPPCPVCMTTPASVAFYTSGIWGGSCSAGPTTGTLNQIDACIWQAVIGGWTVTLQIEDLGGGSYDWILLFDDGSGADPLYNGVYRSTPPLDCCAEVTLDRYTGQSSCGSDAPSTVTITPNCA